MKTKFTVTFTVTSDETLTTADKREFKAALSEKLGKVRVRGFDTVAGIVRQVVPEVAAEKPVRKTRASKVVEEEVTPVRKTRASKVVEEEVAPVRKTRKARVVEEEVAPVRKTRAAKAAKPAARKVSRPAVEDEDLDFDDE